MKPHANHDKKLFVQYVDFEIASNWLIRSGTVLSREVESSYHSDYYCSMPHQNEKDFQCFSETLSVRTYAGEIRKRV
jgi:hypothetical protein